MSDRTWVGFAGASVEIERRDAGAAALVEFLFRHFPSRAAAPACVRLDLAEDGPSTYTLWRDGSVVYSTTPAGPAARLLLAEVISHLALACRDAVVFHAAAVAVSGRGILLPGASGAGKSTLAAWLDHRGFACLSDEMVGVCGGTELVAFPRPICLLADARAVLPEVIEQARREGRLLEAEEELLLAPRSPVPRTVVPLQRVVLPRYDASATTALQPLSKAEAGLRLMATLTYAQSLPEHGFGAVTDLVRRVPVFELRYSRLDDAAEALGPPRPARPAV